MDILNVLVMNSGCPALGVLLMYGFNSLVQTWPRAEAVLKKEPILLEEDIVELGRSICWSKRSAEGFRLSKNLILLLSKRVCNHIHGERIDILK